MLAICSRSNTRQRGTNLQYGRRTDYATAVDFVDADNSGLMQSSTIPTKTMGLDAH
jgi:hypothetical protein